MTRALNSHLPLVAGKMVDRVHKRSDHLIFAPPKRESIRAVR